jgi:hypothetical protein
MSRPWTRNSIISALGRAAIGALLVYAIFVRLFAPIAATADAAQFSGMHSLCVTLSEDGGRAPQPPSHDCEECCLGAVRVVFSAPVSSGAAPVVYVTRLAIAPAWRLEHEASPGAEAWSLERAQRGPPMV